MYKSSYYFDIDRMIHILLHRLNSYNFKSLNELHNLTISLTKVSGNNALTAFPSSVTLSVSHASFHLLYYYLIVIVFFVFLFMFLLFSNLYKQ